MKIIIAKLSDLELDIVGGKIGETVVTGLVNEEISFKTKYNLHKLFKKCSEERSVIAETQKQLFISLGAVQEGDNLVLRELLEDGTENPAYKKLTEETQELMIQEIELGDFNFNIDDFNFKSKSPYSTFMSVAFDLKD